MGVKKMFMEYLQDVYRILMRVLDVLRVIPLPVYIGAFCILIGFSIVKKTINAAITIGSLLLAGYIVWYFVEYII